MGRFLTNYLYFPLGGNKKRELKTLRNLFIIFLISGIWHGASWIFIIWGILHGLVILIHRIWKNRGFKMNRVLAMILTVFSVNIFWIFFRAKNIETAIIIINKLYNIYDIKYFFKENSIRNLFGEEYLLLFNI